MRKLIVLVFGFIAFSGVAQDKYGKIGPDYQLFVKNKLSVAVHYSDLSVPDTETSGVVVDAETGDLFANSIIGEGAFYLYARLKIKELHGTAASFQLGENYFGFDGRQNDIYLNGKIFGDEVISHKPNKEFIQSDEWFEFEI
ncbi:MAG: hypothetical protein HOD37_20085, partial [Bacteroidetes bacterium]|nr:hypothetical protein [Bacteroidota bacterium]